MRIGIFRDFAWFPLSTTILFSFPHCHAGFLFFLLHPASGVAASSSSSAASSAIINTTSSQHHLHDTIYTTPSTQHHQRNTTNTSSSTHHHQHDTIYTTSSTLHHLHYIIKNTIINKTSSTRHHQDNTINTTPSTLSTQRHQHNTINTTSVSFCMAGAALGGHQSHFAWHVQHSEHLSVIGRCSTRSTSRKVRGSPAMIECYGHRLLLRGRCSTSTSVSFCVAGAALGASQCHFAWQVQHSEHLQRRPWKSRDDWILWAPSAHLEVGASQCHFAWQVQHWKHLQRGPRKSGMIEYYGRRLLLRSKCSTWSTSVLFCLAGAAQGASPETSAEVRRRLSFFVVASSLFCFVDLFHTWMSEDIVNMWGYPVLYIYIYFFFLLRGFWWVFGGSRYPYISGHVGFTVTQHGSLVAESNMAMENTPQWSSIHRQDVFSSHVWWQYGESRPTTWTWIHLVLERRSHDYEP